MAALQNLGTALHPFYIRAGTSDQNPFNQIFHEGCYRLDRFQRRTEIAEWIATIEKPLIVDAGANIGAASVFFARQYPRAKIVSLEPEPGNFSLLKRNVENLSVIAMEAALSSCAGMVEVYHPGGPGRGNPAFRTRHTKSIGIPTFSINDIFMLHGDYRPIIVKIDVEGFEGTVFSENLEWLSITPIVMIELHDWMRPKENCAKNFLAAVSKLERDFIYHGETCFSIAHDLEHPK